MKNLNIQAQEILVFIVFGLFMLSCNTTTQETNDVDKWYEAGEWLNGFQITPHESINPQAFAKEYFSNKELWDKSFEWLQSTDLSTIAPGRYVIEAGSSTVTVSEAAAPEFDNVRWENHEKVNDIQLILGGKAHMAVSPISKTIVTEPYDERRDIAFFEVEKGVLHLAEPGMLFIFTPEDVHKAGVKFAGHDTIKRLFIKVRAAD